MSCSISYCSCHLKFLFSVLRVVSYLPVSCFLGVQCPQPEALFSTQYFPLNLLPSSTPRLRTCGNGRAITALHCPIIQGQLTYSAICRHRREGALGPLQPVAGDLCDFKLFTHSLWREAGILQMLPHVKQASTW